MTAYYPFLDTIVELISEISNGVWECRSLTTGKIMEIQEDQLTNFLPF